MAPSPYFDGSRTVQRSLESAGRVSQSRTTEIQDIVRASSARCAHKE